MTNRIQDINDLFSMFHNFEIVGLKLENQTLTIEIILPWSEMWNIENYKMTFEFDGCKNIICIYHRRTSNELIRTETGDYYYPTEELTTSKLNEILKLKLDVLNHGFQKPNNFELFCDSFTSHKNAINGIDFAIIRLSALDYKIFDNDGNHMSLYKMKEWATEWWEGIQKMWDEQKKE